MVCVRENGMITPVRRSHAPGRASLEPDESFLSQYHGQRFRLRVRTAIAYSAPRLAETPGDQRLSLLGQRQRDTARIV